MRVYWDLATESPGVAGWMRLYASLVDSEGTSYVGLGAKTTCVPESRGQKLCGMLGRIILVPPASQGMKPSTEGSAFQ